MSKSAIIKTLKKNESFLIATHVNPDGDALGCQLAMAKILKNMKKTVYLYSEGKPPALYDFLPGIKSIKVLTKKTNLKFDVALIIDCPTLDRIGKVSNLITDQLKIYIDHHPGPKHSKSINLRDSKSA